MDLPATFPHVIWNSISIGLLPFNGDDDVSLSFTATEASCCGMICCIRNSNFSASEAMCVFYFVKIVCKKSDHFLFIQQKIKN